MTGNNALLVEMLVLLPPLCLFNDVISQLARVEGVLGVEEG
jgi:hypothetical protein